MIGYFDIIFDDEIDLFKDTITIDNIKIKDGLGNEYNFSPFGFESWIACPNKLSIRIESFDHEADVSMGKIVDRLFISEESPNKVYFDEIVISTNEMSPKPLRFTYVAFRTRRKETKLKDRMLEEMTEAILWSGCL